MVGTGNGDFTNFTSFQVVLDFVGPAAPMVTAAGANDGSSLNVEFTDSSGATTFRVYCEQAGQAAVATTGAGGASTGATRDQALAESARVPIETDRVSGSINLRGGRLDDLRLSDFHETVDPTSPTIILLSPASGPVSPIQPNSAKYAVGRPRGFKTMIAGLLGSMVSR